MQILLHERWKYNETETITWQITKCSIRFTFIQQEVLVESDAHELKWFYFITMNELIMLSEFSYSSDYEMY